MGSVSTQTGQSDSTVPAVAGSAVAAQASVGTRVLQNTLAQLVGRGVSLVLSAATSILLARYLGRERMGEYGAIYAYLTLYTWIATFGLEQILAREAAQRRKEAGSIFLTGTLVALCFSIAGIALALLLAASFGYGGSLRILILFAAVEILLVPAISIAGVVFQVDMRQWYAVGLGLLRQVLWLVAVGLLAFGRGPVLWVILSRTFVGLATAAITLPVCWRRGLLPGPWTFSWEEAQKLVRYGFPLALSSVAVGLFQRIDQVMLHKMSGDRVLGPYVVAVVLTEQFSVLPVALLSSLFPALSRAAGQENLFRHYLGAGYRFLMTIVFFVCAVIPPVTGPIVGLLYGKEFISSADLITVLIWSEAPLFLAVVLTNAFVAKNLQRYLPITPIVGAFMNIALNLVLIPRWGALGAAWATVISYSAALLFLLFRPTRPILWQGLRIAAPPFALALAVSLTLQHYPIHFVLKFIFAAGLYAGGAWLTGTVRWEDIRRFKEIGLGAFGRSRAQAG